MPKPARTSALTLHDTRISLMEQGAGTPVFFLHGNPGSKEDAAGLFEILADKECHCLAVDRPGHANSQELIPETPDPWLDVDVYAQVIAQKQSAGAFVIGYSLGGFLALKLALKHPDKVNGIGLIAPFVAPTDPNEAPSRIPGLATSPFFGTILGLLLPSLSSGKVQAHLARVYRPAVIPEETLERELNRYTRFESLIAMMTDKNTMLELRQEVMGRLGEIKCPVAAISGAQDEVCSTDRQMEALSGLPQFDKKILEQAGHGLPFTHAADVAEFLFPRL